MTGAIKNISIAKDFSKFPAGRFYSDGPFSGERFRREFLVPALRHAEKVIVELDGVSGFGSSFLDEAFGGLVRHDDFPAQDVISRIELLSTDDSYVDEIKSYISSQ